jgi:hypothetical protein
LERTFLSWNVPNLITVPLMAAIGFLLLGVVWQALKRVTGNGGTVAVSTGGGMSDAG